MNSLKQLDEKEASYVAGLRELRLKMIDATHLLVDELKSDLEENIRRRADVVEIPVEVRLRQVANLLESWKYCPRSRCSRSQCCKGEPNHCLAAGLPLFSPEAIIKACGPGKKSKAKKEHRGSTDLRFR